MCSEYAAGSFSILGNPEDPQGSIPADAVDLVVDEPVLHRWAQRFDQASRAVFREHDVTAGMVLGK